VRQCLRRRGRRPLGILQDRVGADQHQPAFQIVGIEIGSGRQICPPAQNAADEMRWAFVKWVNQDYSVRMKMSAGEALMSMLRESFPCSG